MNRDLDKLIDQALSTYSIEDARPGLEGRVLARVRSHGHRQFRFPLWAWAIPALGCMALVLTNWHAPVPQVLTSDPAVSRMLKNGVKAPLPHGHGSVAAGIILSRARQQAVSPSFQHPVRTKLARAPKRETFPAARALTPEEHSLLAFANQDPETALAFLDRKLTPLEIDLIEIEPLENK